MPSKPRMCQSLLRIVVLAIVLVFAPAKANAAEAFCAEVPVLVVSAASTQVDARPAHVRRIIFSQFVPIETPHAAVQWQLRGAHCFVHVFRRFVTDCAWLC
ncbi:MAG TPA: hypothetical protein VIV60_07285 [Polyangiaceae bacterium]